MLKFLVKILVSCGTFIATFSISDLWVSKQPSIKVDPDNGFGYLPGILLVSIAVTVFISIRFSRWLNRKHK